MENKRQIPRYDSKTNRVYVVHGKIPYTKHSLCGATTTDPEKLVLADNLDDITCLRCNKVRGK